MNRREKGRDLTQSYDKNPYTHRKIQKESNVTTHKRHQNFDYTAIADWLKMVSWSNISHPPVVVKRILIAPTFPLTATAM